MSALVTKLALKKAADKVGKPLQTKVRGAPVWVWAAGIGLTALGVWGTVRYFRASRARKVKAGNSKHSKWANRLIIAMDGGGTTESSIRKVFREIPSQQDWEKVQRAYWIIKGKSESLLDRLEDELYENEYIELMAIIDSKPRLAKDAGAVIYDPDGWAIRINAAINHNSWWFFPGTDEDALKAVFKDIPTIQAFMDTSRVYYQEYDRSMTDDLKDDLSPEEYLNYAKMILRKPRE